MAIQVQLMGHLGVAVAIVCILWLAVGVPTVPPSGGLPRFITQRDMVAVTIRIEVGQPPHVVAVQPLAEGRLSVMPEGPYVVAVWGEDDTLLHEVSFRAGQVVPGLRHPQTITEMVVVVPGAGATFLEVSGPEGMTVFPLETE